MWKKYSYIGLHLIPILAGLAGFITLLKSPYLGVEFQSQDGKVFISSVSPGGPAADMKELIGKEVVAIGDFHLREFDLIEDFDYIQDRESLEHFWKAQKYFSEHIQIGEPLAIAISAPLQQEGNGAIAEVRIIPSAFPVSRAISNTGAIFFSGLFSILIGLLVVIKRQDDKRAAVFFFIVFSVSLVLFTFGSYASRNISFNYSVFSVFWLINSFAFVYVPVTFLHLSLVFPVEKKIARYKAFLITLYSLPLLVLFLFEPRISFLSLTVLFVVCLTGFIAAILHGYITIKSTQERVQIRWVLFGGIFTAITLLTSYVPILFHGYRLFDDRIPIVVFMLVPLSMAIAITKYRLMDIDTLFDSTIIYSITIGLLVLLDAGVISSLIALKILDFNTTNPFIPVSILVWTVIFAYLPLRNGVKRAVKKILKREMYDLNEVSIRFCSQLLPAQKIFSVIERAEGVIDETLHPKGIRAILFKEDIRLRRQHDPPLQWIEEARKLKSARYIYSVSSNENISAEYSGGLIVPISGSGDPVGCIVLKGKHSGNLYTGEDMKLLDMIAGQAALAIERIYQVEESQRRDKEARNEKELLSRDIHDSIGGRFSNAIMMIDLIGKEVADIAGTERLDNLKILASEGLAELRDIIWTLEEDEYNLSDTVCHIKEKIKDRMDGRGTRCETVVDIKDGTLPVPASVRLNIVRFIQEALTNVNKYAQAGIVKISITENEKRLTVKVKDNGTGFDPATIQTKGYGLRNIKSRCEEMGSKLCIYSEPGKGTELAVEIALATASPREETRIFS